MKTYKIILIASVVILQACSNPLGDGVSRVDSNYGGETVTKKPESSRGYDTVSASKTAKTTFSGNYKADVTAGVATNKIKLQSANNKTVYLSVQGQMISN